MRFKRRFAHGAFIWRMELQKNGTPHLHLIVFGVPFIAHQWVAKSWYEIAGTDNPDHLAAGTEVRRVASYKNALAYAAKYAAKLPDSQTGDTEGRVWGVIGRGKIPVHLIQWELEPSGEARLARFIRNLAYSRSGGAGKSEYPPRWLILDGRRGMGAVAWAAGLPPLHADSR